MIRDLDDTIKSMLHNRAPAGSALAGAAVTFDLPDSAWRKKVTKLTVNCYLYDVRENTDLRHEEKVLHRVGNSAIRLVPPIRVDCGYSMTAWSVANTDPVLEEHRLLSQVLLVLLQNRRILQADLKGSMLNQPQPYPWVIAVPDASKNMPDFWKALDQELRPSLNYVVTIGMWVEPVPAALTRVVDSADTVKVIAKNLDEKP